MRFGWWDIDIGGQTLTNRKTGQSLTYRYDIEEDANLGITATPNLRWMRLDYLDSDICHPLLVQRRNVPDQKGNRRSVWRVDYARSARVWAQETNSSSPHPSYGAWRRIDECVLDALACWPKTRTTGSRPDELAIEGGWRNGAWTASLYRSFSTLSETAQESAPDPTMEPWLSPLDLAPPSPWRFVEATGLGAAGSLQTWGFEFSEDSTPFLPANRKLTAIEQDRPYLVREDESAFIIPIALRARPSYHPEADWKQFHVRLLYVDAEMFCDGFEILNDYRTINEAEAVEWTISTNLPANALGAITRGTPQTLTRPEDVTPNTVYADRVGTPTHNWAPSDDALRRRLRSSLSDAILEWATTKVRLPSAGTDELQEVTMPVGSLVNSFGPMIGGVREVSCRIKTASALQPNSIGQPHALLHLFKEDDGIVRVSQRYEHLGWWDYDPESCALVNRISEQRVSFAGAFDGPRDIAESEPGEPQWFRFDYNDRVAAFPVLARRTRRGLEGPLTSRWEVDYNRSRQLWKRESRKASDRPAFGLWRRVHECLCDALVCWPELDATGEAANSVSTVGGWVNADWADLLRTYWRCDTIKRLQSWPPSLGPPFHGKLQDPLSEPLRATAPPAWRFFDAPMAEPGASIDGLTVERREQHLTLAPHAPLRGFEPQVPFTRRDDGHAVLFPHGLYSHLFRGEDYSVEAEMLYADECVLALLRSKWGEVDFMNGLQAKGQRGEAADDSDDLWLLTAEDIYGRPRNYPSLQLYRNLHQNLTDAWLAWSGCDKRLLDDPAHIDELNERGVFRTEYEHSGFSLQRPNSIRFHGAYLGGFYFPRASQVFELRTAAEEKARAEAGARADAKLEFMVDQLRALNMNRKRGKN